MEEILEKAALDPQEITRNRLTEYGMKGEWDKELKSQLALLTDGEAFRIVRAGAKETGLEIWRQLAEGNDPRTEATEHKDLKQLMAWPRCEKLSGLREYISK